MSIECPICRDNITSDRTKLSCSHIFHYKCIVRHAQDSSECPLCETHIGIIPLPTRSNPQTVAIPSANRTNITAQLEREFRNRLIQQHVENALREYLIEQFLNEIKRREEEELYLMIVQDYMQYMIDGFLRQEQQRVEDVPRLIRPPLTHSNVSIASTIDSVPDWAWCCALYFPPLAVYAVKGCSCSLLLNIILTLLLWIPGCCHACCILAPHLEDR